MLVPSWFLWELNPINMNNTIFERRKRQLIEADIQVGSSKEYFETFFDFSVKKSFNYVKKISLAKKNNFIQTPNEEQRS